MLRTAIVILVLAITAFLASARDVVLLEDGRRVEGDIVRELDGNIWMIVYIGDVKQQEFFAASAIKEIMRDAAPDVADRPAGGDEPVDRGAPKGMVVTLEGMVGVEMAANKLEDLLPTIEEEIGEGGILVLKINSGGGFTAEVQILSDFIEYELKPKFEVVGWIESAISAAAMTASTLERLYFMPEGNLGAATEFRGAFNASKGRDLAEILIEMESIVARGKRDGRIMRSMQIDDPLSATIDPRTGEVSWYQSEDDGEILVNRTGDILTLNSVQAEKLRFSEGIARDVFELTREMGFEEIDWVGEWEPGMVHPISKAEREMRRWREDIGQDNAGMQIAFTKYRMYLGAAAGAQGDDRARLVGQARKYLRQVRRYYENAPKLVALVIGIGWDFFDLWYEQQEETLRDLLD